MSRTDSSRRTFVTSAVAALCIPRWTHASRPTVQGSCIPELERVRERFERSFADGDEVGASIAVSMDGKLVLDLWGGYRDAGRTQPWNADTLVCTMSVSKGIVATSAHMLIDRGLIDPEKPVATYWPQFAAAGKEAITVKQLLSHTAALPVADAAAPGDGLRNDALVAALEKQQPVWEPGTKGTYHATTYGALVGELVRRVSGKPIEKFVTEDLAHPLGAEFIFGCSDAELARVAPPIGNPANHMAINGPRTDPMSQRVYRLLGDRAVLRSPTFCRSIFPSASGISNARSLVRIFGALAVGGTLDGVKVMGPQTLERAIEQQWFHEDPIHHDLFRVAQGYLLSSEFTYFGPGQRTFGTAGSGGYTVFADPDRRLSFAYTPNRFTSGDGLGIQPRRLIDALYAAL